MIHFIDDCEQGDDLWFSHRLGSLGGSKASDMLAGGAGKTRLTLARKLVAEKLTGVSTFFNPTPAMLEGVEREDESRNYLSFAEDILIQQCALIKNDKYPGTHYSPDGYCPDKKCIVELKNPMGHTQVELLQTGKISKSYIDQMQFGLLISEYNYCIFMSYVPGIKPFIKHIQADLKYHAELQSKIESFMLELNDIIKQIGG